MKATNTMQKWLRDYVKKQKAALDSVDLKLVEEAAHMVEQARVGGNTVAIIGNGGSLCNAMHFEVDMVKGVNHHLALAGSLFGAHDVRSASNPAMITALSNDVSPTAALLHPFHRGENPVVIGVSVSGTSPNVIDPMRIARKFGYKTILLSRDIKTPKFIDLHIKVRDTHYGRVEDVEMTILHMICYSFMEDAYVPRD